MNDAPTTCQIDQGEINAIFWRACDTFRVTIDASDYENYLTLGTSLDETVQGERKGRSLAFIDWAHWECNVFSAETHAKLFAPGPATDNEAPLPTPAHVVGEAEEAEGAWSLASGAGAPEHGAAVTIHTYRRDIGLATHDYPGGTLTR